MFAQTVELRPGSNGNQVRTILVVDDEAPIRIFLVEYLSDYGLNVIEAANVAEAKALLLEQPIDLVFSDINMPGGETGFGLARWIRQYCPNTKVLLTSGYPQVIADTRYLPEPLILKPYNLSTVLGRIEKLFSGDRA
ncbi:MAG TPA: response regulator [Acetobacteraceae bacterium]|jgi:CheY-like chemotaxis protein|nr:response regulator [Acetobacteraceae bacterium]